MTKDQIGDPERQKSVTPLELLAAVQLLKDYCSSADLEECKKCIFHDSYAGCQLLLAPEEWDLSDVNNRALEWIKKQLPEDRVPYLDTDKYTDE